MARVITAPGIVRNVSKYLNSMRRVPFAIGKDDWTEVDSSTYTYEFVTAYVTTSSFDIGTFDNSVRSYAKGDISMEKKDGGGGMVFTTTKRPTGTVSGSIYIWDNNDNKVPVILEDTVVPIENGGTDATSVPGILSNLGLGSANDAQETLEFGDAVHEDVANNLTTTSEGYVLDARQGKALKDSVDALDGNIAGNEIAANTNLNSLTTPGNYYSPNSSRSATLVNPPTAGAGFSLDVKAQGSNTTQFAQMGNQAWMRGYSAGEWKDWVEVAWNDKLGYVFPSGHTASINDLVTKCTSLADTQIMMFGMGSSVSQTLTGVSGTGFGIAKNVTSASQVQFTYFQPGAGSLTIGTINTSTKAVTVTKQIT